MIKKLKEYKFDNKENLTDKGIKIYDNKNKNKSKSKKSKKRKKTKKSKKGKRKSCVIQNINFNINLPKENKDVPPKRKNKKNKIPEINNNHNSESLNIFKNTSLRNNLNKDSTMKYNNVYNNNLKINEKSEHKHEEIIEKKIKAMEYYNDSELNSLEYKEALEIDKRTYFQYYISLIKKKQILIFTFYPNNDYNSMIIKICLFLFSFVLYYTINALFFNDSTMHKIYEDQGAFNFIYHIPQILYSTIISSVINIIVKKLSLSENNILAIKNGKNIENIDNEKKKY